MFKSGKHAQRRAKSPYRKPATALLTVFMMLTATMAVADNLQSDLDTTTGGLDKTVNRGTLAPNTAYTQDVFLFVQTQPGATNDPVYPFSVSGSGKLGATFSGVTITSAGDANGQTGQVSWTTPAAETSTQSYSIVVTFDANTTINESPATITINFTIAGAPADTTPPVISPQVTGTIGNNGWYTSNVTVSWTVTDAESAISSTSGCDSTVIDTDTTGTTLTCTATSAGGSNSESVTVKRDATAPINVVTTLARYPDHNGWYNAPVDWATTGEDATSGIESCSSGTYSGPDGEDVTVSGTCSDNAGNTSAPSDSAPFDYDDTDPTASVTGVADGAIYLLGAVPVATCATEDNLSGVDAVATVTFSGPGTTSPNGVGSFTATCSDAMDVAGNHQSVPASATYAVHYGGVSGILQPINPDNSSLFSRGKAVPVKFRLDGDAPNGFDYSTWGLHRIQVSCTAFDTEEANLEPVVDNPSNAFRYDAGADQYINNASFKDQAVGTCWKIRVTLDSGQTLDSAVFRLQK